MRLISLSSLLLESTSLFAATIILILLRQASLSNIIGLRTSSSLVTRALIQVDCRYGPPAFVRTHFLRIILLMSIHFKLLRRLHTLQCM
jgi:hypothetical protein